jgi:hypothetical protein
MRATDIDIDVTVRRSTGTRQGMPLTCPQHTQHSVAVSAIISAVSAHVAVSAMGLAVSAHVAVSAMKLAVQLAASAHVSVSANDIISVCPCPVQRYDPHPQLRSAHSPRMLSLIGRFRCWSRCLG